MINRHIANRIIESLKKRNAILLTGARQVGKTTLVKNIANQINKNWDYWNCDEPDIRENLNLPSSTFLKNLIGNKKLIVIDEAQRIPDIGIPVKLITDNFKDVKLIITGSSSIDLRNTVSESLTGRKFEINLFPFSYSELVENSSQLIQKRLLNNRLIYGMYPEITNNPGDEEDMLLEITSSYLYKDVLMLGEIRKPELLDKLLQMLSLQLGSEVSVNELSVNIGVSRETINKYIGLLEKSFVIFSLHSYSKNLRNELKKSRKIYFYDLGIRNSIIKNFNPVELRNDVGALWENFLIVERMKFKNNLKMSSDNYFWRTVQKQEIDFIETSRGNIFAYEFKWNPKAKSKSKTTFKNIYPDSNIQLIHRDNFESFVC